MNELKIHNSCTFASNNNTETGHVWTVQFAGGERVTVTAINHPINKTTTFTIDKLINWWGINYSEVEEMLHRYATQGNWDTRKPIL